MKNVAVLCDFDGTVASDDVGNLLFRTFGRLGDALAVVDRWKQGEISSRECLEQEFAMLDVSRSELDEFILLRKLDPYFKDFLDFTKKRGMEVAIVSDGLDYYIEKMLLRNGSAHIDFLANHLEFVDNSMKLFFPFHDLLECQNCGNCKSFHLEQYRQKGYFIVYVGNGKSDTCACQAADLVFAKGELLRFCQDEGIQHVAFNNFRDVERVVLKRLVIDEDFASARDNKAEGC